jgi:transposase-like protein
MARRNYSDDDKATALAALAANEGNLKRTAQQLGIPRRTLEHWSKGKSHPAVRELAHQKKAELADRLEDIAHQLLDALPDKIANASLQHTAITLGIAVEKMRLLREQPTSISIGGDLSDDERLNRLRELADRAKRRRLEASNASGTNGVGPFDGQATNGAPRN